MYDILLPLHSLVRWFVLLSLIYAIYTALMGYTQGWQFTKKHNNIRHWTATIAHIQLILGILIYTQSIVVKAFFSGKADNGGLEPAFFGVIHIASMLMAIVLITIGSAKAKRKAEDNEKFKIILIWFSIALFIILMAIPWPFSPLANRPYFRNFQ